jgi:hypothetical protein
VAHPTTTLISIPFTKTLFCKLLQNSFLFYSGFYCIILYCIGHTLIVLYLYYTVKCAHTVALLIKLPSSRLPAWMARLSFGTLILVVSLRICPPFACKIALNTSAVRFFWHNCLMMDYEEIKKKRNWKSKSKSKKQYGVV